MKITNTGTRTELVRWVDSRFSAALVRKGPNGQLRFGEEIYASVHSLHVNLKASTIDPGITDAYAFLIPVEFDGVYLVESSLAGSPMETTAAIDEAVSVGAAKAQDLAYWSAITYCTVGEHWSQPPNTTMQPTASDGG